MDPTAARRSAVAVLQRLSALGLIGGGEGNVSLRLDALLVLATPTGVNKALLQPDDLCVVDLQGRRRSGRKAPSSELPMHLAVYRARPEVRAIVHAHPPTAVAVTLAGIRLDTPLMAEAVTALGGGIPTAPYATPSTEEMGEVVARTLEGYDACLMERHGAIAVGPTLALACDRMETVERVAQVVLRAKLLGGNPTALPPAEIERLLSLSGRARC